MLCKYPSSKRNFASPYSLSSSSTSVRSLLIMPLLTSSIHCNLGFTFLFLPATFHSNIIFGILLLLILFKSSPSSSPSSSSSSSCLVLQYRESVLFLYVPLPAVSGVRPLFPIKYFSFLQISLYTILPSISLNLFPSGLLLRYFFYILSVFIANLVQHVS